jgi:hypothetical protein
MAAIIMAIRKKAIKSEESGNVNQTPYCRTFGPNRFDLVHCRFLVGSVADVPGLLKQSFNALKPGGWHEENEIELTVYWYEHPFDFTQLTPSEILMQSQR